MLMSSRRFGLIAIALLVGTVLASAQATPDFAAPAPDLQVLAALPVQQTSGAPLAGTIKGSIVDRTGAVVPGARVSLARQNQPLSPDVISGADGQFSYASIAPGPFQLTVNASGFSPQSATGLLHPGEILTVPAVTLTVATALTEVDVALSPVEVAEEQIKDEEKQRVLKVIPNFYVTYDPHAVPLDSRQKFKLAWRSTVDPVNFGIIGMIAGIQQAQNSFSGYGQGAQGYGKRYGASFADFAAGTFIGSAILPSVLKQDPRYFYKGTGSHRSRFLYAVANSVICKGDNGQWQPNYSNVLGNLAAGGISNLYYPAENRNGPGLTFENALIGIGATAIANVVQEFVFRKVTSNVPNSAAVKP